MILALDSYYKDDTCNTSLVLFENEKSSEPIYTDTIYTKVTSDYIPGEFYKRELPGIEKILTKFIKEHFDWWDKTYIIITDSFVTLKNGCDEWKGLGSYLKEYLKSIGYNKVIYGVAKTNFCDCDKISEVIYRGKSKTPLYVQSSTLDNIGVRFMIQNMHGEYRIPTMLKLVDQLSRKF